MNKLLLPLIAILFSMGANAQNIQEQFESFRNEASTWEDYKVIKINKLREFWGIVSDTLVKNQEDIKKANLKITQLESDADSLEASLKNLKVDYEESESVNSSIGFLGISINKVVYNIVVWSIIAGLCFAVGSIYLMFKTSNKVTREVKGSHMELKEEYEAYKEKATKKQVALKRELQTAINTLEENRIKVSNKLGYNRGTSSI